MAYVRLTLALAFVLFASAAVEADTTPPRLLTFSISPSSFDSSSGPTVLSVRIAAHDDADGATIVAGSAGVVLTQQSGSAVFGQPSIAVFAASTTEMFFEFQIEIPQASPAGVYGLTLTLTDVAGNQAVYDPAALQALRLPFTVTITPAAPTTITILPVNADVGSAAVAGSVRVTAIQPGAVWTATSNAPWLAITSGSSGAGNGSVNYLAEANTLSTPRTGVITVNNQTFTLTQAGLASAINTIESGLSFSSQAGAASPDPKTLTVYSNGPPISFTATASSTGNWLAVGSSGGVTSAVLTVNVNTTGLAPGSYSGSVTLSTLSTAALTIPVSLTIASAQPVLIRPSSLQFEYTSGGSVPAPQSISVSGASGASFVASASSAANWLALSVLTGSLPASLTASVTPGALSAGTYSGTITVNASGAAAQTLPVTLIVNGSPGSAPVNTTQSLSISPTALSFSYQAGTANPAPQSISVSGASGAAFTTIATSDARWLTVTPLSGASPATLMAVVTPSSLAVGNYTGTIIVTPVGAAIESQSIRIALTVSPGAVAPPLTLPPSPRITSIVNAASYLGGPLAAGQIISIFGGDLGPQDQELEQLTATGAIDTSLASTRVMIDGKYAPILFSQHDQVNTIVPYSASGKSTVQVQLEYQSVKATVATFAVADAAPAVFTLDGTGKGPAALLNQDASANFDLNPADRSSIAVLYATGAGVMSPASQDGAISGSTLAHPILPVSVLVDGRDADVIYAGSAPGEVAGVIQVNFRIPAQTKTGSNVGLLLKVGRFTSQPGITISVR